jgi:hypothetical protein
MRKLISIGWLLACVFSAQSVTLDRIAASVGKHVILESDVLRSLRIVAFLDQKPVDMSAAARRRAVERLVDQELILREAVENRAVLPGDEEAAQLLEPVKLQYGPDEEYGAALASLAVSEDELRAHLLAAYRTLRFTEARFRPEVQVSEDELRDFYQLLAAGWRRGRDGGIPAFDDAREQVERLVVEQKVTQALDAWLASARVQAGVTYRDKVLE